MPQRYVVGRFGWKAAVGSLLQQTAGAYNGDMGITSSLFPAKPCEGCRSGCERHAALGARVAPRHRCRCRGGVDASATDSPAVAEAVVRRELFAPTTPAASEPNAAVASGTDS